MIKEIKYFIFFLTIILFFFITIKFYISDENKKKTFRNLNLIDDKLKYYNSKLPIIINDTESILEYLNNNNNLQKKNYSFWDLLKSEN